MWNEVMTSDEEREEAELKFLVMARRGKLKELEARKAQAEAQLAMAELAAKKES